MIEQRLRNIELHLRSLEVQRKAALASGDDSRVARAEQLIVQLEAQVVGLTELLAGDAPPTEEEQGRRQHILAVNGDPDILNILRLLLQDERFNVTTTNYVPRTYAQIAALQPALLIIDLAVGHRAGWDLLERLQTEALTHEIPVIVVGDRGLVDRARTEQGRYGGQRFLPAPLDLDRLLAAIDELIGAA